MLFYLEHAIQDASLTRTGDRRVISKRMLYVELDADGHDAPRALRALSRLPPSGRRTNPAWRRSSLGPNAHGSTARSGAEGAGLRRRPCGAGASPRCATGKLDAIAKTEAAVKDRLTKEITYWDHRAEQLKLQEQAGKPNARLNSGEARKRADDLQARLQKRLDELKLEAPDLASAPGGPRRACWSCRWGCIAAMKGRHVAAPATPIDTQAAAAQARAIVMEIERSLGFEPTDREFEKLGYDVESRVPGTGKLRFIEVKGRVTGADDDHRHQERNPLLSQQARRFHPRDRRVPRRRLAPRPLRAPALPARAGLRGDER